MKRARSKSRSRPLQSSIPDSKPDSSSATVGFVSVLCLGDLGRSPRMQNHAESLANNGFKVTLIGHSGTDCRESLIHHPNIQIIQFAPVNFSTSYSPSPSASAASTSRVFSVFSKFLKFLVFLPLKVFFQFFQLFFLLLTIPRLDSLLIQNPPSIPTLLVSFIVCLTRGASFFIDWHNFGFTILNINLKQKNSSNLSNHNYNAENIQYNYSTDSNINSAAAASAVAASSSSPSSFPLLVSLAYHYERFFSHFSCENFTVTNSMKTYLTSDWCLNASRCHVLHDKPPEQIFNEFSIKNSNGGKTNEIQRKHEFWMAMMKSDWGQEFAEWGNSEAGTMANKSHYDEVTPFTGLIGGSYELLSARPAILVSSTSWTADEDFSILLRSISEYEKRAKLNSKLPFLVIFITGKGPMKQQFVDSLSVSALFRVRVFTLFLPAEYYPRLLGASDLGVSLHYSSSGLDLPMKVVDMFGARLPVCAIKFRCLGELIEENVTGKLFATDEELADQWVELFSEWPKSPILNRLRAGVEDWNSMSWESCWRQTALPVFKRKRKVSKQIYFGTFMAVAMLAIAVGAVSHALLHSIGFT